MPPFLLKIKGFDKTNSRSYFVVYDALCTYFHIPSLPRFPLGARSPTFTRTPTPHLAGDSTLNFGTHMVSISHAFLTPDLRSMINTMIWGQFTFRPSRGGGLSFCIKDARPTRGGGSTISRHLLLFVKELYCLTWAHEGEGSKIPDFLDGCPLNHRVNAVVIPRGVSC